MVISTSLLLRASTALFSILLVVVAAVTLYASLDGDVLVGRFLGAGDYTWYRVLRMAGEDGPNTHNIKLEYDTATEKVVRIAAGSGILAGLFGVVRVGVQEWERRRRRARGRDLVISRTTASKILSHTAIVVTFLGFLASFVSATYVWQQHTEVQQKTCYWQLGENPDAVLKCTREVAVCELSPRLIKRDVSDRAQGFRRQGCEHLQLAREMLLPLLFLSFFLVIGYGAQLYMTHREDRQSTMMEKRIESARSSTDSRISNCSFGSSSSNRIEKAE